MTDCGWICLYRKSIENPLFQKPLVWHYWQYCLLKANHTDQKIIWNKKEMVIEKGSFITGRKKAAQETGLSERNIRTALDTLVSLGMVVKSTSKSTSKFTYLTICNYGKYQEKNNSANQQSDQQVTSKRPQTTMITKEYPNKIKTFVEGYINYISKTFQNKAPKNTPALFQKSCESISKLKRLDGFEEDYIFNVLRWAQKDSFWQSQILSLSAIRTKSKNNDNIKFKTLAIAYDKTNKEPITEKRTTVFTVKPEYRGQE